MSFIGNLFLANKAASVERTISSGRSMSIEWAYWAKNLTTKVAYLNGDNMLSKKKIIIIAVVVVAVVAVVGVYLWQSLTASFAEVEETINNFVSEVSSYDAEGAWALTSQDYQESWGEYIEFENLVDSLYEKVWHATIQSISSRTMETKNGITTASVTLTAGITDTEQGTYTETWIFKLVRINNEWKIDDWLVQD